MKKIIALSAILISFSILFLASIFFYHYVNDGIGGFLIVGTFIGIIFVLLMIPNPSKPSSNDINNKE